MKKSWIICLCIVLSMIILSVILIAGKLFHDWMRVELIKLQTSEAEYSWVNKKPLKVELESKKDLSQKIEALGLRLSVPWEDMSLINKENNLYTFESEDFRIVIIKQKDLLTADIINNLIDEKRSTQFYRSLTQNYGQQVMRSNYKFNQVILNTTQEDLEKCYSNKKLDMLYVLRTLKCQVIPNDAKTGIYYFEKDSIRGFQFGAESKIVLWVYNNNDEKYQISISRRTKAHNRIAKDILNEVNRILPTMEFIN